MRTPARKRGRRAAPATLSAALVGHVTLAAGRDGRILASFDGHSVGFGTLSTGAAARVQELRTGLRLASLSSRRSADKEIDLMVRRLARHGLLEYRLRRPRSEEDLVVIEPQVADYWPQMAKLGDTDVVVLSRFAYLRRRGNELVLESPRAGALFKICDPRIAAIVATLSSPQQVKRLRRHDGFPGIELLALLADSRMLFKVKAGDSGLRPTEGDDSLVLWDFHDLLFHARSTEGRHANPLGAVSPYAGVIAPLPAVRPGWRGQKIDLSEVSAGQSPALSPVAALLRQRHSTRDFDDARPITLADLACFLDGTARVLAKSQGSFDYGESGPVVEYATRPYPSAGASYELELYLAVDNCDGLVRGFYHYDADEHALVPLGVRAEDLDALLTGAAFAMGAPAAPQVLITIAARFGRVSWKYSSIAYELILKDVGVVMQTLYLMAAEMALGACAIGTVNIDLFAKMTEIEFHVEGPVGQFALGRAAKAPGSD